MDAFLNTLVKSCGDATSKDHRLEYGELSRKDLDKICEYKCDNVVDLGAGMAGVLIYAFLNSSATNISGFEICKERYDLGVKNLAKLHRYLRKNKITTILVKLKGHTMLSSDKKTLIYYHMSMYEPMAKQKVSMANVIVANVGYFYRMRYKYKGIFENLQPGVKIISYKGPKFVDDQYIIQ